MDREINSKLINWGVLPVSTITRRLYPGTDIADGTRYVKVKFTATVQSLPYSTRFDTVEGPKYFRVIHDRQEKVCRLCIKPGHLFKDCPLFTCHECFGQGHFARVCTAPRCPECKKTLMRCQCENGSETDEREVGMDHVEGGNPSSESVTPAGVVEGGKDSPVDGGSVEPAETTGESGQNNDVGAAVGEDGGLQPAEVGAGEKQVEMQMDVAVLVFEGGQQEEGMIQAAEGECPTVTAAIEQQTSEVSRECKEHQQVGVVDVAIQEEEPRLSGADNGRKSHPAVPRSCVRKIVPCIETISSRVVSRPRPKKLNKDTLKAVTQRAGRDNAYKVLTEEEA